MNEMLINNFRPTPFDQGNNRQFAASYRDDQVRGETKNQSENWLHLEARTVRHFDATTSLNLVCSEGLAWVTQASDPRDYILRPGQSLTLSGRGRVVVEALRFTKISVPIPVPRTTSLSAFTIVGPPTFNDLQGRRKRNTGAAFAEVKEAVTA